MWPFLTTALPAPFSRHDRPPPRRPTMTRPLPQLLLLPQSRRHYRLERARRRGWAGNSSAIFALCRLQKGAAMEAAAEEEAVGRFSDTQRLKAACHYTVAGICEEVSQDKEIQFSKQTIAAISEITFRQCEFFAKDLEMFARHAKRSTVNLEDVKLLARRSKSLLKYITEKSEEIALNSLEEKEKRKKKSGSRKGRRASDEQEEHVVAESDDSNMA